MISKFWNKFDDTCVIIGNGKSLSNISNEWLCKYPTFGANRIYLKFIPDYFVCTNPLVIEQNKDDIEKLKCVKFIRQGYIDKAIPLRLEPQKIFSYSPHISLYEGYTVTFVSLQLAYYFGFTTVLLVGVDHSYQYNGKENLENTLEGDDPNHFDVNYFKGQKWNNPDLRQSEISYTMAKEAYQKDGRRIINLTEGSKLEVFEKGNINDW